jgi:HKD family nuclease
MAKENIRKTMLDYWTPPQAVTDEGTVRKIIPIAFISTSFTFDADFFDEECLSRFLALETEKENDGTAYLIEREEKLASLQGGIVLVDQNFCHGRRNLRWDLVPCRVKQGVLHAKITVLYWSDCIRLIIGSANLTQPGYCINQEIFGVIDYMPNGDCDLRLIEGVLTYLNEMVNDLCGKTIGDRYKKIQSKIRSALKKWNINETKYKRDEIALELLMCSPKEKNVLQRLKEIWDTYSLSPAHHAYITSPFFDTEASPNMPSLRIFDVLRQRGSAHVCYNVTTEPVSVKSKKLIVNAPDFLKQTPRPDSHEVNFCQVSEEGIKEDGQMAPRPLHLKSIWLCNEDAQLYMIGSGNFTSAAFGLGKWVNYEANLVYCVSADKNKKAYNLLHESYLPGNDLETHKMVFRQRPNEDEATTSCEYLQLPDFCKEAVLLKIEDQFHLDLSFDTSSPPAGFSINYAVKKDDGYDPICIFNEAHWHLNGQQQTIRLEWNEAHMPDFLLVDWNESNGMAFWPVIIDDQISLPPVESLRDLPLDTLIKILSSTQPLHRLLKIIEQTKGSRQQGTEQPIIDFHQLVDTSQFLLQRTRRISYAMRALRARLEKPVYTKESLNWRLYGPIGVQALKDAILKEAKTEDEKLFLVAELALELSRINPEHTEICLKPYEVKAAIQKVIKELTAIFPEANGDDHSIVTYSVKAIQKANEF